MPIAAGGGWLWGSEGQMSLGRLATWSGGVAARMLGTIFDGGFRWLFAHRIFGQKNLSRILSGTY